MNPESPLIHAKHVFRAAILLLAVLIAMLLGRSLFVPETWGEFGPYRGAAVAEHRDKPIRHGGNDSCAMCHDAEYADHATGVHASVQCESCHGPVAFHVDLEEGEVVAEMPVQRVRQVFRRSTSASTSSPMAASSRPTHVSNATTPTHRFDDQETPWHVMTKTPPALSFRFRVASS